MAATALISYRLTISQYTPIKPFQNFGIQLIQNCQINFIWLQIFPGFWQLRNQTACGSQTVERREQKEK